MKNWYAITNKADGRAEISIFGPIGNTWDGEGVTARQFMTDFKAIKAQDIDLLVNSPGGSLFDGVSIYTVMASSGKNITAKVLGVAASAASVLLMAAKRIEMPKNTHMMAHKAGWWASGNADDLRAAADVLDGLDKSIVATYAARTGKSEEEIAALLEQGDVWMSADEAKAAGFCDEVTELVSITNKFDLDTLPENIRAALQPPKPANPPAPTPEAKTLVEKITAAAKAAGLTEPMAKAIAMDPATVSDEAAMAAIAEAREIVALAEVAGRPEDAENLVRMRKPLAEARAELSARDVAEANATHVDTAPKARQAQPKADNDLHVGNLWNEIKAMQAGGTKK